MDVALFAGNEENISEAFSLKKFCVNVSRLIMQIAILLTRLLSSMMNIEILYKYRPTNNAMQVDR